MKTLVVSLSIWADDEGQDGDFSIEMRIFYPFWEFDENAYFKMLSNVSYDFKLL